MKITYKALIDITENVNGKMIFENDVFTVNSVLMRDGYSLLLITHTLNADDKKERANYINLETLNNFCENIV